MCERKHLAGAVLSLCLLARPAAADSVRLISRVAPGLSSATADRESATYMLFPWAVYNPPPAGSRLSADGRYAVFSSHAGNLIAGLTDANNGADLYLHDRMAGTTVLITRSAAAPLITSGLMTANGPAMAPVISADGRYVAYFSTATNLVTGQVDVPGTSDVFVFDRVTGSNSLVSRAAGTSATAGNRESVLPVLSADGRWIAFSSKAEDLVAGQGEGPAFRNQVFLFDRTTGTMVLVSHAAAAAATPGNGESDSPSLSADGAFLAYGSEATDLEAGLTDSNGAKDVFLYDRVQGQSVLVSRSSVLPTQTAEDESSGPILSADGSHIAFVSKASDLVAGPSGPAALPNVFLYRRSDGSRTRISNASAERGAHSPAPSQDASHVAFVEDSVVFLYQRSDGTATRLSAEPPASSWSEEGHPRISADGGQVAFARRLTLDTQPISYQEDVFLYSRASGTRVLVNHSLSSPSTRGNSSAITPELSADGQIVAFASFASDLVEHDFNHQTDVFLFHRATGTNAAASLAAVPTQSPARSSRRPGISDDGNIVVFDSASPNLVPGQVDVNWGDDVFVWSRIDGTTRRVSQVDGVSRAAAVSADGDWIAFKNFTGASSRLFLVERATGTTVLATHVAGAPAVSSPGATPSEEPPMLSRDGRFLAFTGTFTDLQPGETLDGRTHAFLYDRLTDRTVVASRAAGAGPASGGGAGAIALSADGRFLVFTSTATDLIPGLTDPNSAADVFLSDLETGEIRLVSRISGSPAAAGNGASSSPKISADGRWIVFSSLASDLVAGQVDSAATPDIFLYDQVTGATVLVSHLPGQPATAGGMEVDPPGLSADGRFVVFASRLDSPSVRLFLYDRTTGENVLVSPGHSSPGLPRISADGRFVAFTSGSGTRTAYLYERSTGTLELLSRGNGLPLVEGQGTALTLSADGGQIVFDSVSSLVPEDDNSFFTDLTDLYLYENVLPAQDFHSMVLCRALDTRQPIDGPALTSEVREYFTVPGACGIPATAKAVVLNVTVAQATGAGSLKLHPGNAGSPASTINFAAGQVRSNNTVVRLANNGDGTIAITPFVAGGGTVHVILDVMGYFE